MEKTSDLSKMNEVLNNKTLKYRIDGFAKACRIEVPIDTDKGDQTCLYYETKDKEKIFIALGGNSDGIKLSGYYGDLNFTFVNYYNEQDDLDTEIVDLPFDIVLSKTYRKGDKTIEDPLNYAHNTDGKPLTIDNLVYRLTISGRNRICVTVEESREDRSKTFVHSTKFYTDYKEFNDILKLIKLFIVSHELLLLNIDKIMRTRVNEFSNEEFDTLLMDDNRLDKPYTKSL